MPLTAELTDMMIRFGFNLFIAFVIIKLIYDRKNDFNDFVFTYFMFNSLIFFFAFLLSKVDIDIGFGFGLFAVFAILRYRTDPIPIKEMTYLFIVITIGMINALVNIDNSYTSILFANFTIIILTYIFENKWQSNFYLSQIVMYENIENIKPENHEKLLSDLQLRTGLIINHFEIRRINFLRDTARIKIFYKE